MTGAHAPQWLPAAFCRSIKAVGGQADKATVHEVAADLIARWQEPQRYFHNLTHLIDILQRVDTLAAETHHPDCVRLAAWYHGAIFDTSNIRHYKQAAGKDETGSADLARTQLTNLAVPAAEVSRICDIITTLAGHSCSDNIDAQALCDADLGSLAVEPQKYRTYRENVRREYEHVPLLDYLEARTAIIERFLARPHIFTTPMATQWEDAARENLAAELQRLQAERDRVLASEHADEATLPVSESIEHVRSFYPNAAPDHHGAADLENPANSDGGSSVATPETNGSDRDDMALLAQEKHQAQRRRAELIGGPIQPAATDVSVGTTSSGIEREPSDLRSLPRRNATVMRMDKRGENPTITPGKGVEMTPIRRKKRSANPEEESAGVRPMTSEE
ncbi:MAG: hypothetical protein Q4Q03_00245 [Bowdeniella nasicola]|nr:hypothetical protein [Bowdeniella nasicola]